MRITGAVIAIGLLHRVRTVAETITVVATCEKVGIIIRV